MAQDEALGRLPEFSPVGVVDIGSNSVRLVVYDGARRSPAPIFNEKVLCGLGRGLARTGRMEDAAIESALRALKRFRVISRQTGAHQLLAFATAAARDAENGAEFIANAHDVLGHDIEVLSGQREAELAASGVLSGVMEADGLVGDLGGGSLELVELRDGQIRAGTTFPLGPLRLIDMSDGSLEKARAIIDDTFSKSGFFKKLKPRPKRFYAVGGNWRNLARVHMHQHQYPLHVLHQYRIASGAARAVARLISELSAETLKDVAVINPNRAETLPYAALVLDRLLRYMPAGGDVIISSLGAREGMLYQALPEAARADDPLLSACRDFARLRARSPEHAIELCNWSDQLFGDKPRLKETPGQRRLRHAACLLADIGWRAHPDYRGEQSMTIISQAAFVGIDHPGRIFLSLTVYYRYEGAMSDSGTMNFEQLADEDEVERARLVSAIQRLAYVLSAAMPGILPEIRLVLEKKKLLLSIPKHLADFEGERVVRRLNDVAMLAGRKPLLEIAG